MRAILAYHSIDDSGSVISMDEATFRGHADWLADGGPSVVPLAELLARDDDEDVLALTFDDGFRSFGSTAWPILRERGLPASVFVVSGHAGGTNEWGGRREPDIPVLDLLDWDELGALDEEGVEIGSHTRGHPHLAGLDAARLEDEVAGAAEEIGMRLGRRPAGFAYPYGSLDAAAETRVSALHEWACSTELDVLGPGTPRHRLPRLDAYYYRRPGTLEAWGSARFRVRLATRQAGRRARARLAERRVR